MASPQEFLKTPPVELTKEGGVVKLALTGKNSLEVQNLINSLCDRAEILGYWLVHLTEKDTSGTLFFKKKS